MNKPWSCYLDAVIRLTQVHEGQLLSLIGHDGSDLVTELPAPYCYRGFNPHIVGMALMELGWLAATYPSKIEEYTSMSKAPSLTSVVSNLRNHLICLNRPVIYCTESHAVGYTPEELGMLPVQEPEYFTILTPLPK